MFSGNVSVWDVSGQLFLSKLKANIGLFYTLAILQILGVLFSTNGTGMMGTSMDSLKVDVTTYSANFVLVFSFLWAFISSMLLTTRAYRNDHNAFVSNNLTNHLSNLFLLITMSLIAGVTAMLSRGIIQMIMLLNGSKDYIFDFSGESFVFWTGIISSSLYIFLIAVIGYFVGSLLQLFKIFILVLPAAFIGLVFQQVRVSGKSSFLVQIFQFYGGEPNLSLFLLKVLLTALLLFFASVLFTRQVEVR